MTVNILSQSVLAVWAHFSRQSLQRSLSEVCARTCSRFGRNGEISFLQFEALVRDPQKKSISFLSGLLTGCLRLTDL
jgi:hypothetical protein